MAEPSAHDLTGKLTFSHDKGAGRSKWIAIFLALLLFGWMGSGYILPTPTEEAETEENAPRVVTVAVMPSVAQDIDLVLTAEGQSTPDRSTMIRSESGGQVLSVAVARGDLVTAGQEIGRINDETIQAQLAQARATLEQATRDFENAEALQERGVGTQDRVTQARASKAAAEAAETQALDLLDKTIIRAPFDGRLNDLTLDVGEFVNPGDVVAEVLDNDPLAIVVQVPQQALARIVKGQEAEVSFITGQTRTGVVGFIGNNADSQTRTFRVEVNVDNPQSEMPAGLSARVAVPTGKARGHFISPAILSLGTSGDLGIKMVNENNEVVFSAIEIVRAQTDGVWVTGLPEMAQIITVGQGFVNAGDVVDPKIVSASGADQ